VPDAPAAVPAKRAGRPSKKGVPLPFTTEQRQKAQRKRRTAEKAIDNAVTQEEFHRAFRRLYLIATMEDSSPQVLPSVIRAIEILCHYKLGKPKVVVEATVDSTVTFEHRIAMAKAAAGMVAFDPEIIDGDVATEPEGSPAIPGGDRAGVPALPAPVDLRHEQVPGVLEGGQDGDNVLPLVEVGQEAVLPRPPQEAHE
jgi:hypothetical protein